MSLNKTRTRKSSSKASTKQLEELLSFDRETLDAPRTVPVELLIGTDEVGRGCLAGPVVAAAVILPEIDPSSPLGLQLVKLNDSKKIDPVVRTELALILRGICKFAIGEANVKEIDEINILQASLLAMRRAVHQLNVVSPAVVLVDGNKQISSLGNFQQLTVVGGDGRSAAIAAASIIAKVHRDAFMTGLSRQFPHYKWDSNKGYQSPDHWQAINEHGICQWHRRTFVKI